MRFRTEADRKYQKFKIYTIINTLFNLSIKKYIMSQQPRNIQIKIDDETLKGRYANMMQVAHSREEFIMDFMNIFPPTGIVVSRIITRPEHFKRIVTALQENLRRYEQSFGEIKAAEGPGGQSFGFKTE